jgi:hypothetical protein
MFYAYYTSLDPNVYQAEAVLGELEASGFQHTRQVGNLVVTEQRLGEILTNNPELKAGYFVTESLDKIFEGETMTDEQLAEYEPLVYVARSSNEVFAYGWIVDIAKYREWSLSRAEKIVNEPSY